MRAALYAILGSLTGAVAAAAVLYLRLGDLPGSWLSEEFYLYPGLIFGLAFGILFWVEGRLKPVGAVAFALAATVSNALAVVAWTTTDKPIASLLGAEDTGDMMFGVTGGIAGAVGGGLLGCCAGLLLRVTGWPRMLAAGAALGLFLPLVQSQTGFYAFYVLWQAGYAATMATVGTRKAVRFVHGARHAMRSAVFAKRR
jgi:hypothetical protein